MRTFLVQEKSIPALKRSNDAHSTQRKWLPSSRVSAHKAGEPALIEIFTKAMSSAEGDMEDVFMLA